MGQGFLQVPFGVWYAQAKFLLEFIALLWVISFIDLACLNHAIFLTLSRRPRTLGGFFYLPLSGLFHKDWDHLMGNTIYLLLFGGIIALRDPSQLLMVTLVSAFVSGWALWLVGRPSRYLGASNILFGYLGFVVTSAILEKDAVSAILIAWLLFSFFFGNYSFFFNPDALKQYQDTVGVDRFILNVKWTLWTAGNSFWGIFPDKDPQVGWEGHLFGLGSGILAANYQTVLTPWVNQWAAWIQQLRSIS